MAAIPAKKISMETWEQILSQSIFDPGTLSSFLKIDDPGLNEVVEKYPMRVNPYYLELIKDGGSSVYRQAVPDIMPRNI